MEIPKNITDFAFADADLAGRGVSVAADAALELDPERVAELCNIAIGLSRLDQNRICPLTCTSEVSSLNCSRFVQDGKVDAGPEVKAAFVSADRALELDAVALIDFDLRLSHS
jgi:hypothetical protein